MKTAIQKPRKNKARPNPISKKKDSSRKKSAGISELDLTPQQTGSNTPSFSEEHDVTPPNPHGFPSFGNPETDFVSRDHGRQTSRMLDDVPGI